MLASCAEPSGPAFAGGLNSLGRWAWKYINAFFTALTTARGVIVAPVNWSNVPPSRLTAH